MTKPLLISVQLLCIISLLLVLQGCARETTRVSKEIPHTHPPVGSAPSNSQRTPPATPTKIKTNSKSIKKPFRVQVNPTQIVSAHNKVRSKFRLQPLSWSPSLAHFSTKWANHLKNTNGCNMRHRPHSGKNKTDFGENLYWASPFRWSDGATEIQKVTSHNVVNEWAKEDRYYNYRANRCQPGQQCGHYTQIVWRSSRKVGCGLAICPDKSQVWVCSYDPPGNWVGQRPY